MTAARDDDRRRAAQAIRAGAVVLVVSVAIVFLPLLLGGNAFNKYLVAFGLVGAFVGLGWMTNGLIDLIRVRHH